ncbi:hypothetical protein SprV_0401722200 [Sparganum proliferum]
MQSKVVIQHTGSLRRQSLWYDGMVVAGPCCADGTRNVALGYGGISPGRCVFVFATPDQQTWVFSPSSVLSMPHISLHPNSMTDSPGAIPNSPESSLLLYLNASHFVLLSRLFSAIKAS